jgi:hypothetical protein
MELGNPICNDGYVQINLQSLKLILDQWPLFEGWQHISFVIRV